MTVAGRGGRPRKWNSDADRVRAFRARARGDEEPTTVEAALERGDEGATAWAQVRQLSATVEEQRMVVRSLQRDLRAAQRSLAEQQRRFSWLDTENERLRARLSAASGGERDSPSGG